MPKVSVIVPVYKVEKYIGRCIESIKKQTLTDWELILVDDCSPDNSIGIINEYASKDERIIVKRHDSNHGPMIARRLGDMLSKGEYIAYCDGDDTLPENALMFLYTAAKKNDADMVIGGYSVVEVNGITKDVVSKTKEIKGGEEFFKALLIHKVPQSLWGKLFKADVINGYGYKVIDHMTNAEDAYMLYQMIPHIHTIVNINDVVYNYIKNIESSSQRRYSERALDNILLVNVLRISLIDKYPQLKKDILCFVSNVLNGLYIEGYNKDGLLQRQIEYHRLQDYTSDKVIVSTHNIFSAIKLLIRKHVLYR